MIGATFGNTCFSSVALAQDAYFHSIAPVILPSGGTASYQFISGIWQYVVSTPPAAPVYAFAFMPALDACDIMQGFNDGLVLGGLLAAVSVCATLFGIVSWAAK